MCIQRLRNGLLSQAVTGSPINHDKSRHSAPLYWAIGFAVCEFWRFSMRRLISLWFQLHIAVLDKLHDPSDRSAVDLHVGQHIRVGPAVVFH